MTFHLLARFLRVQHWTLPLVINVFLAYPRMDFLVALLLPIVFCQQGILFGVNDYFDREIDAKDSTKRLRNVLSSRELTLTQSRVILALLLIVSVVFSLMIGWTAFILNGVWVVLAIFYTAPPIRFKKRVGLDLLVHGVTVLSFPFLFTMVVSDHITLRNITMGTILVCISVFAQLLQETRDVDTDSLVERNSVIAMGFRMSFVLMLVLLVLSLFLSSFVVVTDRAPVLFALVSTLILTWIYDLIKTWKTGKIKNINQKLFGNLLRRAGVCLIPILLFWALT